MKNKQLSDKETQTFCLVFAILFFSSGLVFFDYWPNISTSKIYLCVVSSVFGFVFANWLWAVKK